MDVFLFICVLLSLGMGMLLIGIGVSRYTGVFEMMLGGWVRLPDRSLKTKTMIIGGLVSCLLGTSFLALNPITRAKPVSYTPKIKQHNNSSQGQEKCRKRKVVELSFPVLVPGAGTGIMPGW